MNLHDFCYMYNVDNDKLKLRKISRGLVLSFYPRPSSYRKSNKGETYWKYARYQLIKYCPWEINYNRLIGLSDDIIYYDDKKV